MKKRSVRLQKIIALAEAEERHLGAITGRAQARLKEQVARLGELNVYRQEYADKAQGNEQLHSAHWKDYQNFLFRLDGAVRSQQAIVQECQQNLEAHRRQWMVKRQRLESLDRVRERFEQEERIHEDRIEQRTQDELPTAAESYKREG